MREHSKPEVEGHTNQAFLLHMLAGSRTAGGKSEAALLSGIGKGLTSQQVLSLDIILDLASSARSSQQSQTPKQHIQRPTSGTARYCRCCPCSIHQANLPVDPMAWLQWKTQRCSFRTFRWDISFSL